MGRPGKKAERLSVEDDFIATPIMDHNQSVNITAENLYSNSVSIDRRKKLGQFFTPNSIANIMTDWIASINPKNIIDPAIGTGVFLRSVNAQLSSEYNFDSFDIDPLIASFIPKDIPTARYRVRIQDFLTAKIDKNYDAAIMNPPYLRHHDMLYDIDIHSYISSLIKKPISKLANSYMLFVIRACHLLKVGGRGAFIIPTEWSNANFGKALKEYLIDTGLLRHIIYFSNC
jgi:adenine-specific DNA-methyltransferase